MRLPSQIAPVVRAIHIRGVLVTGSGTVLIRANGLGSTSSDIGQFSSSMDSLLGIWFSAAWKNFCRTAFCLGGCTTHRRDSFAMVEDGTGI